MINYKKVLAGALATSMVMGNSLIVFAADQTGNTSGDGSFEGTADVPDVFKVTLPTVTSGTFDYIADPEGLASGSAADKYSGAAFDTGSLFFKTTNPDDNSIKYSSTSEKIEVVNKSSIAVDIDVKATVTPVAGINLSESNTFATDDKSTSIYLNGILLQASMKRRKKLLFLRMHTIIANMSFILQVLVMQMEIGLMHHYFLLSI